VVTELAGWAVQKEVAATAVAEAVGAATAAVAMAAVAMVVAAKAAENRALGAPTAVGGSPSSSHSLNTSLHCQRTFELVLCLAVQ
jgi:hypothetical protein